MRCSKTKQLIWSGRLRTRFFNGFITMKSFEVPYTTWFKERGGQRGWEKRRCHQVTTQTWLTLKTSIMMRWEVWFASFSWPRCMRCGWDLGGETRCHYHIYYCKKCHADKVCSKCVSLLDFEPQAFRFEQNGTTLTTACTSTYNGPLKGQPILQNITINLLHFAWMYVWMNECKEKKWANHFIL